MILYLLYDNHPLFAQEQDLIVRKLVESGFENVAIRQDATGYLIAAEPAPWKQNWEGVKNAIKTLKQLIPSTQNYQLVILERGIPRISLNQPTGSGPWEVSYNIPPAWKQLKKEPSRNRSTFKTDLTFHPELLFRNIKVEKPYDLVINLSPALEISLWKGAWATFQVILPLLNDYGLQYKYIRPGFITLSQEFRLPRNFFVTATLGIFNKERWGGDLEIFHPFKDDRFAITANIALTGPSAFEKWHWSYNNPRKITGSLGGQFYYPRFQLQCNVSACRFIGRDYGVRAQMMRHFDRASIGLYAIKSNCGRFSAGFNLAIALPPYRNKRNSGFRVTTADYFGIEYNGVNEPFFRNSFSTQPSQTQANDNFTPKYIQKYINH